MSKTRWSNAIDRIAQDCSGVEGYEFDAQYGLHKLHAMPGFVFVTRHRGCDDDLLCDAGDSLVAETAIEMHELIARSCLGCWVIVY